MPLSAWHPWLYTLSVRRQCLLRELLDGLCKTRFATERAGHVLPVVVVRHRSLLRRRLRASDPRRQELIAPNHCLVIYLIKIADGAQRYDASHVTGA